MIFLRKIVKGETDKSYGIHVAKLAGVPFKAIQRAEEMLIELELKSSRKNNRLPTKKTKEYPLFAYSPPPSTTSPIIEELKNLDVNNISPIEALQKLFEIKEKALK